MANSDFEKMSSFLMFVATTSKFLSEESIRTMLSPETLEQASKCKNGRQLMELIDSLNLPELEQKTLGDPEHFRTDSVLDDLLQAGKSPDRKDIEERAIIAGMSDVKASGTFSEEVSEGASSGAQAGAVVGGVIGGLGGGSVGCAAGVVVGAVSGAVGGAVGGVIKWAIGDD